MIARDSSGVLYYYRGDGEGEFGGSGIQIGSGFNTMTWMVSLGDFDGDGNIDLITRRSDVKLFMYWGNGSGGWLNGGNATQIDTGWGSMTWIHSPGDFSGDGNSDLIARKSDGTLWLYRGNGSGGWVSGLYPQIGSNWNQMTWIGSSGDVAETGKSISSLVVTTASCSCIEGMVPEGLSPALAKKSVMGETQ